MLDDIKQKKQKFNKKEDPKVEWIGAAKEGVQKIEEAKVEVPKANEKKDQKEYQEYIKELYQVIDKIEQNQSAHREKGQKTFEED